MDWDSLALRTQRRIVRKLGEDVSYTPAGGGAVVVRGVFERTHQAVDPDTGVPFYSTNPVLTVVAGDLPEDSPRPGDSVTRKGETFRVVGGQPDGNGGTMLELKS